MSTSGTTTPQLGFVLPPAVPPNVLWPAVESAEAGGIDSIWVTDRTLSDVPWLETMTLLGALAARTSRVRIGTCVVSIARRNPVLVAHALATAQYLSGGRVVAGIGLGGQRPGEYELCGMTNAQRGPVTDEYLPLLRRLWTEDSVDHDGAFYSCRDVQLRPLPEVPIPLWVGGYSPGAFTRAGRYADGYISAFVGPDGLRAGIDQVRAAADAAGRDAESLDFGAYVFAAIGRRPGEAEAVLEPAVRNIMGAGLDVVGDSCMYGTPDQWVDQIGGFAAAGARTVNFLLFTADLPGDLDLVLGEVVPQVKGRASLAGV